MPLFIWTVKLLQSSSVSDTCTKFTGIFLQAISAKLSLVILDDLDVLLPIVRIDDDEDTRLTRDKPLHRNQSNLVVIQKAKLILDHLVNLMDSIKRINHPKLGHHQVIIICTCINEHSIHHEILLTTRFAMQVELSPLFHPNERMYLFYTMLKTLHIPIKDSGYLKAKQFSEKTEGYRPYDIVMVAMRKVAAYELNGLRNKSSSFPEHELLGALIDQNIQSYIPLCKKSFTQQVSKVHLSWSCIGGLFKAKERLAQVILRPVRYKHIYEHSPISLPRGILLFGPNGCGKSIIVPALAEEIGFNLVTCPGPEILDKYIGMSEAKVRRLFEQAYALSPSILFFDDFDALAPKRGRDSTGATDRVVNQLLTYLDGVEGRLKEKGHVYIIAATSRPDKLDPALPRPGRLESHIYIGKPESSEEWADLFAKIATESTLVIKVIIYYFKA